MCNAAQYTVAVVDDDFRVRESLESLLESSGFLARLFPSAEEFLEANLIGQIAVLISDVRMPGIDGIELQRRVRVASPDLPIILITAHHEDDVRQNSAEMKAFHFLQKPFDAEELLGIVQSAIEPPK